MPVKLAFGARRFVSSSSNEGVAGFAFDLDVPGLRRGMWPVLLKTTAATLRPPELSDQDPRRRNGRVRRTFALKRRSIARSAIESFAGSMPICRANEAPS